VWTTRDLTDAQLFASNPKMAPTGAVVMFSLPQSVVNGLQNSGQLQVAGSIYRFQQGALPTVNSVPRTVIPVPTSP
jgi:hypothetical protein